MSAFFCNDATLTKVVAAVMKSVDEFCFMPTYRRTPDWTQLRREAASKIGVALREMNAEALRQRYGETFSADELAFTFADTPDCSDIALLKACHCFGYQCAEGDVPETNPLFEELKIAQGALADEIVSALPEYDRAAWGD